MKRVCHITTVHTPFDDRIFFKQCVSLAQAGFETMLVAPIAEPSIVSGVQLLPVKVPGNRLLRMVLGGWRAWRIARSVRADVYQVHDPELLWVALLLKNADNAVVYDMHESMRENILSKKWIGPLWWRRVLAVVYGRFERWVVRRCDAVLVVVDYMREELEQYHPGYADKFLVVRNLPVLGIIDQVIKPVPHSGAFTLIYAGGMSEVRGIHEVIEAIALVPGNRLKLLGSWSNPTYRARCMALPGWQQVEEVGKVRMDAVYDHLRAADAGVCIFHPLHNHLISAPVKSYEYMACRLPMLMSDFPRWREDYGAFALFVDPMDPAAIAAGIRAMMNDPAGRAQRGAAGRKAVEEGLSWEQEARRLVDLYRQLTS